jgi:hypothetical protein
MKNIPTQLMVGLGILLIGGGIVGGEYCLVNWYPLHKEAVKEETLKATTYKNDDLGFELQVAAGINKKVETFNGGARIFAPMFWADGPSLTITSRPNPDKTAEFTPQELAIWETDGVQHNLWRYDFQQARINDRNAVLIWQYKNKAMQITARVIAPDHIVEADCTPGSADEALYLVACEESLRTIKVAGAPSPDQPAPGGADQILDLTHVRH